MSTEATEDRWPQPIGIWPIILWSTGAAILGTGIYFGVRSKVKIKDDAAYEAANRKALIANISFGVGGSVVLAGFLAWLLDFPEKGGTEPAANLMVSDESFFATAGFSF